MSTAPLMLDVRGDPLGALRRLVAAVWRSGELDGLVVAAEPGTDDEGPRILDAPADLERVNPFRPVMPSNLARSLPALVARQPGRRLGVLVRPCEARALTAMAEIDGFDRDRIVAICVDCLSTLPLSDYRRLTGRPASRDAAAEAVRFAAQGGISPYRYRAACQACSSPAATDGDVMVGVLGLPARRALLVAARDDDTRRRLRLDDTCDGPLPRDLVSSRARLLSRLAERRARARERQARDVADALPLSAPDVVEMLQPCAPCRSCLDACPLVVVAPVSRGDGGRLGADAVERWLASCVGCGMCEQACPCRMPLAVAFRGVHEALVARRRPAATPRRPLAVE